MHDISLKPYLKLPQQTECMDCGNCRAICPARVLSSKETNSGFRITIAVDPSSCTSCGACLKSCPVINTSPTPGTTMPDFYAAWHKNPSVVQKSSSGGVFTGLAQGVLREGGVVVGVVLNNNRAVYKISQSEEDIQPMLGSKYLPSSIAEIYDQVCIHLKQGRSVLFVGLPCQVAGLKQRLILDNIHGDLITVDLLCAGTPAPKLLDYEVAQKHICVEGFRDKSQFSWVNSQVLSCINIKSKQKIIIEKKHSAFLRAFHANFIYRDICYHCPYAQLPRCGDISLGDFWGIQKYEEHLQGGISLTSVNTPRGKELLQKCADFIEYNSVSFSEAAQQNTRLYSGLKPLGDHWLHKSLDFVCAHFPYLIIKLLYCGPYRMPILGKVPYNLLYHCHNKTKIRQINANLFSNINKNTKDSL